jgi:hypothetical protein
MSIQSLLIAVIAVSLSALAAQPLWPELQSTRTIKPRPFVGGYQDRCHTCGCKGGPGWRVRLTGQCAYWKTLKEQCGDPPSKVRCNKES